MRLILFDVDGTLLDARRAGSRAALLELLESPSRVTAEDAKELRQVILEGRRDANWSGPFAQETGAREGTP